MTTGAPPVFDRIWRAQRRRLLQIAFRMLSDLDDAEDVVQEAFGRLAAAGLDDIDDPVGWLIVVTGRLCLDRLRSRRRHPTTGLDLAEATPSPGATDPSEHVSLVDSVTLTLHVVLERLTPAERTAFILHDVFRLPFDDIGEIVGRSAASCRQLASRARRRVGDAAAARRVPVEDAVQRLVAERFVAACNDGDLGRLVAVLDPDVDGLGDDGRDIQVGADAVAAGTMRYLGPASRLTLLQLPVGDRIGVIALRERGVAALVVLEISGERIVHIEAVSGPAARQAIGQAIGLDGRRWPAADCRATRDRR